MLIYAFLKKNSNKKFYSQEIDSYVNRKTKSCDRYYQVKAALCGKTYYDEEPSFSDMAKKLGVFASIERSIDTKGKTLYQFGK